MKHIETYVPYYAETSEEETTPQPEAEAGPSEPSESGTASTIVLPREQRMAVDTQAPSANEGSSTNEGQSEQRNIDAAISNLQTMTEALTTLRNANPSLADGVFAMIPVHLRQTLTSEEMASTTAKLKSLVEDIVSLRRPST
ncbi:MAG: hypothetical protein Q9159_005230 [Coniocarpon cinnabarinum]